MKYFNIYNLSALLFTVFIVIFIFLFTISSGPKNKRVIDKISFYYSWYFLVVIGLLFSFLFFELILIDDGISLCLFIILFIPILENSIGVMMFLMTDKMLSIKEIENETNFSDLDIEKKLPKVSFVMASYEEPLDVKKMTVDSILNIDYPGSKEIISTDNSKNTTSPEYLEWIDYINEINSDSVINTSVTAKFKHNFETQKLKPGNLDLALQMVTGEYVVFVDVDSSFQKSKKPINRALKLFNQDPNIAFIQFHIVPTNGHFNKITNGVSLFQHMYGSTDNVGGMGGFTLFRGHNAIWRKEVLDKIGSWYETYNEEVVLVEDFSKTFKTYTKGYYGKILWDKTGEWVPNSIDAFDSMWNRWIYGSLQVLFKNIFTFIRSKEFTRYEKFEILRHIRFGFYFLPYFILILVILIPNKVMIPYIFSCILIGVTQVFIAFKNDTKLIKSLSFFDRLMCIYTALSFSSFVNWIGIRASISFLIKRIKTSKWIVLKPVKTLLKISQSKSNGWKVTGKGIDKKQSIKSSILNQISFFSTQLSFLIMALYIFIYVPESKDQFFLRLFAFFHFLQLLLLPVFYGNQGRSIDNNVETASIEMKLKTK